MATKTETTDKERPQPPQPPPQPPQHQEPQQKLLRAERIDAKPPVLILPDGQRVCLNHVQSYAAGGDAGIHFVMGPNHTVHWRCPHGWKVKGVWKNAEQKEREAAVEDVLDGIDDLFRKRDFRE